MTVRASTFKHFEANMRYLPPGGELIYHVLQTTRTPWRAPSSTSLPLDHHAHHDLRVDLVCKVLQTQANYELQNMDKFILSVPYYVIWTFPVSFYARAKHLAKNKDCAPELKAFLAQPILRYITKGGDLTNQQLITFVQYIAYNARQQDFFKKIAANYACCVDVQMLNSYFEDFLVQSDLELFSALDLNSVLVDQHMKNFEFSIDQRTFKTSSSSSPSSAYNYYYRYNTHGGEEFKLRDVKLTRFIITRRAPAKESLATPYEIWRAMTEFWRDLTKPTGKQLSDFIFNLAAFDIEVGYTCSLKQRRSTETETDTESEEKIPNTIPTFINGFCQCICFRTADYSGYIDVNSMTTYQFVYIPPNIDSTSFLSMWQKRIGDKGFWFRKNNCVVFRNEKEMIHQFLSSALTYIDILCGYNSKNFDMPFLVMRYNYLNLASPMEAFTARLCQYNFAYGYTAAVNNVGIESMNIRCPQCSEANNLLGVTFLNGSNVADCVKCRAAIKITWQSMEDVVCEIKSDRGFDQMPFIYHHDLINSQFAQKCENRKLDTVCTDTFREVISKKSVSYVSGEGVLMVRLNRDFVSGREVVELFDLFMIGVRVVFFSKQHLSKQQCAIAEGRIRNLLWQNAAEPGVTEPIQLFDHSQLAGAVCVKRTCDKKLTHVWLKIDMNEAGARNLIDKLTEDVEIFLSVGKTCEISREDQMYWRKLEHVVETIFYCDVDARLTFTLERIGKAITDIFNAGFLETFPFRLMQMKSGQKVLSKISRRLIKEIFVVKLVNPLQAHLYFTTALAVEGVRAAIPPERNAGNGILKLPVYEFAEDMMRFDGDSVNVNEWHLGTMGEFPLDDLAAVQKSLANLLDAKDAV